MRAEAGPSEGDAASGGFARATLVVCPLVAVLQWRQEIERFTLPDTLKVGPKPHDSIQQDVMLV